MVALRSAILRRSPDDRFLAQSFESRPSRIRPFRSIPIQMQRDVCFEAGNRGVRTSWFGAEPPRRSGQVSPLPEAAGVPPYDQLGSPSDHLTFEGGWRATRLGSRPLSGFQPREEKEECR